MSNDRYFCSCTFVIRTGHWSPSTAPCGAAGHWLPSLYSAWSTIRRCCWCCPHESVRPPWFYWMSARYPSCCWSHAAPRFNYIAPRRLFNWPTDGLLHSSIPMWCEKGTDPFSRQINNSTRYSVMVGGGRRDWPELWRGPIWHWLHTLNCVWGHLARRAINKQPVDAV